MHNVVKPTELPVSAQQQFEGWIMPVSKFVTSFTYLTTNMSRLWRATTAIARTEKLMSETSCGLIVPYKPNNSQADTSQSATISAQD